ncbi:sensor histidine kinase [Limibacterium fermenti]|uniref:sensor histidine kinase n=1 Tax=Limibacterium fermenti TaxID=3229863 RepID=UPI000E92CDAC|nr:hypothetical protein [Porphyromonadaceae bacterium]
MNTEIASISFVYRFLFGKPFRVGRHALLAFALAIIALGRQVHCYQLYPGISLPLWIFFVVSIFAVYLAVAYLNLYYLLPHYLFKGKYSKYIFLLSGVVFIFVFLQTTQELALYLGLSPTYYLSHLKPGSIGDFFSFFLTNMICLFGLSATALLRQWNNEREEVAQLEKQKVQTEIRTFKEQLNPAFISAVLRLTSDLVQNDSSKVSVILFQLSQLLRYQLYDCRREKVLLQAEVNFISDYLKLERICSCRFDYSVQVEESMQPMWIPPLLFMPFVRYAVEHIHIGENPFIHLSFEHSGDGLQFTCRLENAYFSTDTSALQPVRQRIELLYPEVYCLNYDTDSITLKLENND